MPISFVAIEKKEKDKKQPTSNIFVTARMSVPPGGNRVARSLLLNNIYWHRRASVIMSTASMIFLIMMLIGVVVGIHKAKQR